MKKKNILLIILLLGVLLAVKGVTLAKYVYNSAHNHYLSSKGFYFKSDYLKETSTDNLYNSWDGESIHFNIYNSKNKSLITKYDINYELKCEIIDSDVSTKCLLNGTNDSTFNGTISSVKTCTDGDITYNYNEEECLNNNLTWDYIQNIDDLYFNVESPDVKDVNVLITLKTTAPYSKTLKGNFLLHRNSNTENITFKYKRYDELGKLVITNTYNENKCLNITWDASKLRIHGDNYLNYTKDANNYINSIKIQVLKQNSLSLEYYKVTNDEFSDFSYSELDSCE